MQWSDLGEGCRLSRETDAKCVRFERVLMIQGTLVCFWARDCLSYSAAFINADQSGTRKGSWVWTRESYGRESYGSLCVFPVDERVRLHVTVPLRDWNNAVMVDHFNHERETSWTHAENRKSL